MSIRNNAFVSFLGTLKYYIFVELYYRLLARFNSRIGVSDKKRTPPLIVSLTSFNERFNKLHLCIESLLQQSIKPDRLILWLSYAEKDRIPPTITRLSDRGLEIKFCEDIRSYKKIIFALLEFPEALIATADDDIFYPKTWLADLYLSYQKEPQFIHCHRAHLMTKTQQGSLKPYKEWKFCANGIQGPSLLLFPTGEGGVLYAPNMLNQQVTNVDLFRELCPTADDVWLKAMSLLNAIPCKKIAANSKSFIQIKGTQSKALWKENTEQNKNDIQINSVFEHFSLYSKLH